MYPFFMTFACSMGVVVLITLLILIKSLRDEVMALNQERETFGVADREFKLSVTNTSTRYFTLLQELTDKTTLRTNLILDQIEDLKRAVIKKEEFERLFELLKREKILIENSYDDASKKAYKDKWDMFGTALGGKKEEKE